MNGAQKRRTLLAVTLVSLLVWAGWHGVLWYAERTAQTWYGTWQATGVEPQSGERYVCTMALAPYQRLNAREFAVRCEFGLVYRDPAVRIAEVEPLPAVIRGDALYLPPQTKDGRGDLTWLGRKGADEIISIRHFRFHKISAEVLPEAALVTRSLDSARALPARE